MADLTNLISFTNVGLSIASFVEIREALVNKYKEVYGSDIDLSTGSADGVFVNELALIMNNIVQTCSVAYSNLDVNYASGIYLDALCAQSNIFRRPATKSTASLTLTNIGSSSITLDNPEFVDLDGTIWDYQGTITLGTTSPANSVSIVVTCRDAGPIEAQAGWSTKTRDVQPIQVVQANNAIVGLPVETDDELRARRAQSSGASGTTTIESVIAALLQLDGIYDVKVHNNNSEANDTLIDGTTVEPHSIYVAIHKNPNVTIENETIGNIIHQKLTPGVKTTPSTSSSGIPQSWQFFDSVYGRQVTETEEYIYWKECEGIHLPITITLKNLFQFNANTADVIGSNVISYVNGLSIGTSLYNNDRVLTNIRNAINNSDPGYRGSATFSIDTITVSSSINPWAYYDYSITTVTPIYQTPGDSTTPIVGYTIVLS